MPGDFTQGVDFLKNCCCGWCREVWGVNWEFTSGLGSDQGDHELISKNLITYVLVFQLVLYNLFIVFQFNIAFYKTTIKLTLSRPA